MLSELDLLDRFEIEHGLEKGLLVILISHSLLVYPYNIKDIVDVAERDWILDSQLFQERFRFSSNFFPHFTFITQDSCNCL